MILWDEFSNDTYKAMKLVKNRHHICWLGLKMQFHAVRLRQVKGLGIVYSYIPSASYIRGILLVLLYMYFSIVVKEIIYLLALSSIQLWSVRIVSFLLKNMLSCRYLGLPVKV